MVSESPYPSFSGLFREITYLKEDNLSLDGLDRESSGWEELSYWNTLRKQEKQKGRIWNLREERRGFYNFFFGFFPS